MYSKIIAGVMTWGKWGKQMNTSEMQNYIESCVAENITTFDHADIYGDYTTEAEFGKALSNSTIKRNEIQLISKCGIQLVGQTRSNNVKHYNYSKEYILWSVENSLQHLKTDYLDLLLLHRPSPLLNPIEVMEAITQLKKEGKIVNFGVSNFTPQQIDLLKSELEISVNQIEFSLTYFEAMHNGTLDYLQKNKIKTMAWSPLGNYFKENSTQTLRIKKVLTTLQTKYKASESQLVLAWILKHPAGVIPVVGTTSLERIKNSLNATEIDIELEDWFKLLQASQGKEVA